MWLGEIQMPDLSIDMLKEALAILTDSKESGELLIAPRFLVIQPRMVKYARRVLWPTKRRNAAFRARKRWRREHRACR